MSGRLQTGLPSAVAGILLLAGCGEPPRPPAHGLPEYHAPGADPLSRPELDVMSPGPLGEEALFAGIKDRPSSVVAAPRTEPPSPPRRFQVEEETDNTRETATVIDLSGEVWGWMHPPLADGSADEDWFEAEVDLDRPHALTVELEPVEGIDLSLELWHRGAGAAPHRVLRADAYGPGQGEQIGNVAISNGTTFLRVAAEKTSGGIPWNVRDPYRLKLRTGEVAGNRELEPDDDERHANRLQADVTMEATLFLGDQDFYFLETSRLGLDARLALDLLPDPGLGLRWEVMTPDRVTVLRGTTEPGQRGQVPNLAVLPGAEGIFVVVRGPETLEGLAGYTVTATVNALEGRTELEPDDSPETAVRVEVPATVTGWLHAPGDRDLFLVSPGEAAAVRVDLDGLPGVRPALEILDAEGETVSRIEAPAPGEGLSLPNWRPTPGAALLAVVAQEGAAPMVPYSLAIQPRDTEGEETEPNDTPADGTAVAPGEEGIQAWISLPGDRDCFLLPAVEPGGTLSISLVEAGDRSIRGTVFGPGGEPLDQVTVDAGTSGRLRVQPEAPDGMVLCVEAVDATPSASRNGYRVACLPHRPEPLEDGR